jgi:hypothetical protein
MKLTLVPGLGLFLLACSSASPTPLETAPAAPAPATSYTAAQVQAAGAACAEPHGPVVDYSTVGELKNLTVGGWLLCPADSDAGYDYPIASGAWAPDGSYHQLDPDGQGGLVEGQGLEETAVWGVDNGSDSSDVCVATGAMCVLEISFGGGWRNMPVGFESSPRRMLLQDAWYVALE